MLKIAEVAPERPTAAPMGDVADAAWAFRASSISRMTENGRSYGKTLCKNGLMKLEKKDG